MNIFLRRALYLANVCAAFAEFVLCIQVSILTVRAVVFPTTILTRQQFLRFVSHVRVDGSSKISSRSIHIRDFCRQFAEFHVIVQWMVFRDGLGDSSDFEIVVQLFPTRLRGSPLVSARSLGQVTFTTCTVGHV